MYEEHRKALLQTCQDIMSAERGLWKTYASSKPLPQRSWVQLNLSPNYAKKTISAYTCTSARPIFNVATITQRAHKPNFFFTFYFFFVFSFLFRRICHAKCFELQPQNVLFSAAVDPTVSICSNYCEQRREESLQLCAVGSEKVLQDFNTQKLLQNICIWTRE